MLQTSEINRLAALDTRPHQTFSLYLGLDQSRDGRLARLAQMLKDAEQHWGGNGNAQAWQALQTDIQKATRLVGELPMGPQRGLALFSCQAQGLDEVLTLPLVAPNLVEIGPSPYIRPLAALAGDHGQTVVVLIDSRQVRFFDGYLGMLTERQELALQGESPAKQSDGARGRGGNSRLGRRADEMAARLHKEAAAQLLDMCQAGKCQQVIIAGAKTATEAFKEFLHPYLLDRLGGTIAMDVGAPLAEIQKQVAQVQFVGRRQRQEGMLTSLMEGMGPGGKVATGLNQVLASLYEGQVNTLFVSRGFKPAGGFCPNCKRLRHVAGSCPLCNAELTPVNDVVNLAVASAMAQGARLEQIDGDSPLNDLGHIAALLRYA